MHETQINKYNPEWLERNNLTEEWFEDQYSHIKTAIDNCKYSVFKFCVMDYMALSACISACFGYSFQASAPDDLTGLIEVTVYIK
jgi:hypothetical protein